jgi:aminoglycoside phosphotransferase (APT) family kinase protein
VTAVRRLARGASSLTYLADTTHAAMDRIVVKVAPSGLAATRHRDVLRQARLLASLSARGGVPVPWILFTDPGDEVVGPLFAMSFCAGEAFEPNVDDPPVPAPTARDLGARALEATRILARLHSPDSLPEWIHEERTVSLTEEVDRWDRAFATLPGEFGLDWSASSRRLRDAMPAATEPRLTHGDYRLGNMLCAAGDVAAVVDWEIWAPSDHRLDIGWFLLNLDTSYPAAVRDTPGLPSRAEVLAAYAGAGGAASIPIDWFIAVALYKFAATVGLIGKNAMKRGESDAWGVRMIPHLPTALRRIDELLEGA